MNISTGIAEINLSRAGSNSPVSGINYIWPKYQEGMVQKVGDALSRGNEPLYYKPGVAEREQIIGMMFKIESGYDSSGRIENNRPFVKPGSLFTALA
jgi:hypothetical protein